MTYAQAAALEAALLHARLAAEAATAHLEAAEAIAERAGLLVIDDTLGPVGLQRATEYVATKQRALIRLVRQVELGLQDRLAKEGDAVALRTSEARAAEWATYAPEQPRRRGRRPKAESDAT